MVINPSPVYVPVSTANVPTESVRSEARLQERVPETKASTEGVNLKPSADENQQSSRSEGNRSEASRNDADANRQVQQREQGEGGQQGDRDERQNERQDRREEALQQQEIQKLTQSDRQVKAHEAAHATVGGQYAGAPTYTFKRGPDGKSYAVAGEVPIDISAVPGNPSATIRKMQQVQRAALAPADPSGQDRRVAAQAAAKSLEASAELQQQQRAQSEARSEEDARSTSFSSSESSARERFEQKLQDSGAVDSYNSGDRLSVLA